MSCKKEYFTDEVPVVQAATDSLNFSGGWEGSLTVDTDGEGWLISESIGSLDVATLHANDRVFAVLQVGLQWPNESCMNDLHVSGGTILCQNAAETPDSQEVIPFSGQMLAEAWTSGESMEQFVRIEELSIQETMNAAVIQAYVKPWTSQCSAVAPQCYITNRSLSLVIIHQH